MPIHAATQSVTETNDFRVAVFSPNTLLVGVWAKLGMVPTLIQPMAAIKGGADSVLSSTQRCEYQLVWIDVCRIEQYIAANHVNRYYSRVVMIVEAACRRNIPVVMAGQILMAGTVTSCTTSSIARGSLKASMLGAAMASLLKIAGGQHGQATSRS